MARLTEAFVASWRGDGRHRMLFDRQPGFGLRITPDGTKTFIAQVRLGGRKHRVRLGRHPDISVAQARELALQAIADLRQGHDPALARKTRDKALAAGAVTLRALAERWMAEHVRPKLKPRTVFDYEQLLTKHILPPLGRLPVAQIERSDILTLHASMQRTPRRANYVVSTVRAILNFGIDLGLRPPGSNPARRIKMYRERKRERFLSEIEIARAADGIAQAERAGRIGPHAAAGIRLALFTGARSGEVTAARWAHVDWGRKIIRLPDSKTNEPRTIHLSDAALDVLTGLPRVGPYIVAGANVGEPYKNLGRAWIIARGLVGLDDVRLHDLRHSYASLAAGKGVSLPMIGKLLGHRNPTTTNRYLHLTRDAAASVNDQLGAAMASAIGRGAPQGASVTRLPRRRRQQSRQSP
jgi:integrase